MTRVTLHLKNIYVFFKKYSVTRVTRFESPKEHGEFGVTRGATRVVTRVMRCNSRLKYKIKR